MPLRSLPRIRPQHVVSVAAFVDTETTGFSPYSDEVIELAILLFAFRRETGQIEGILDEYVGLRQPGRPVAVGARRVHHISDEELRGQDLDHDRIRLMFRQAEFVVAHNASFDRGFVSALYPEARTKAWLCSMNGVDWRGRGFPSRRLQDLLQAHGIRPGHSHRGLADAEAALVLLSHPSADGRPYFLELLARLPAPA